MMLERLDTLNLFLISLDDESISREAQILQGQVAVIQGESQKSHVHLNLLNGKFGLVGA